ncbi:hypothetical protein GGP41_002359 [Bipolaris sorokiniana]|uniref:Uncharacterized protein n=1 Tax=Cochliobolus sativus TaxID=45130 RepID=A0A8H6DW71_COCSA|nr:hypothetical protein GGP41_002359 [Bipolaris sorokiniana]
MASTVLGKRTRSSTRVDASDAKLNVATRSKRRTQFVIHDEGEIENPFVTPKKQNAQIEDAMDVDEPEEKPSTRRRRKTGTTPAKKFEPCSRFPLSSAKENSPQKSLVDIPEKFAPTPSTPRHRDALAAKVAVTPRHRLIIPGRPLTPRTPHTPGTPRHTAPTVYNEARQVFARGSAPAARGLKPQLLPFLPYNAAQISSVITSKLKALLPAGSTSQLPFLHPTAIMFLSKKVAAQSGDLRKAFDICRRAIDLIEADTRDQHAKKATEITPSPTPSPSKAPLVENDNLASLASRSPSKPKDLSTAIAASLASLTVETAPRATIAHMAKITAAVFSNGTSQRLRNLNLQQKAVLCSLSAIEKRRRATAADTVLSTPSRSHTTSPTIKDLFEAYTALCKRENILHPLSSTEFRDIVASLESLSLISAVDGKAGSLDVFCAGTPSRRGRAKAFPGVVVEERRVASVVGEKELAESLVGPGAAILRGILEAEGVR